MSPTHSPRTRKLLVLPALVAALLLAVAPAAGVAKSDKSGKGQSTAAAKKPYGHGDGRKIK